MSRRTPGIRPPSLSGREVEVTVEGLGGKGDGIAKLGPDRLYLPFTVPGDRVKARVTGKRGEGFAGAVTAYRAEGPQRAKPICPHFERCGGCAAQHFDDALYAEWKSGIVVEALASHGLPADRLGPLWRLPLGRRRRTAFAFKRLARSVVLGFNARASATIVDLEACAILDPTIVALLPALRELIGQVAEANGSGEAMLTLTDTGLDLVLIADSKLDLFRRETLAAFAQAQGLARLSWRQPDEPLAQPVVQLRAPQLTFGGVTVLVPPGAFLQASPEGEEAIRAAVMAGLGAPNRVADLYAGVGTLGLPIAAAGAIVTAIEGDAEAVAALAQAVRLHRGVRMETERRDLARRPLAAEELDVFDAVIFDPPRAGALAQVQEIAQSRRLARLIAVSCNPATFARDAAILVKAGWTFTSLAPIDQFPYSPHLEIVAHFQRR